MKAIPFALLLLAGSPGALDEPRGWLSWRGPNQNGTSDETGLPDAVTVDGEGHLWSYDVRGRGTPVVANGRVFGLGYEGEGKELSEFLFCLDSETGELLWEHRWSDFLSDTIYDRYAIGSPTVDPETGNVYAMSTPGILMAFTRDGDPLWERAMFAEFGRITFPNGRTGAPLVDGDLVIYHIINAHWGREQGPARDRFYAFDKLTGECVWGTTPGTGPKDSSFSMPVVEWRDGERILYAGTGCGHMVAIRVGDGRTLWRFPMAVGGVNSAAVLHGDRLVAIHGKENLDSSVIGRMVSMPLGARPAEDGPAVVTEEHWRADLVAFTSSPVLVGDRVYETTYHGDLVCVDASSGAVLWKEHLAPDQIHASPAWGDGKLYVPMNNGSFFVVRPGETGGEILDSEQLAGNCLGAPAIAGGRVYVHTTERLYCFGTLGGDGPVWPAPEAPPAFGDAAALQVVPTEIVARPGDRIPLRARALDAKGNRIGEVDGASFGGRLPAGVTVDGGVLAIADDAKPGAFVVAASLGELSGSSRVRVVPNLPYVVDFEDFELTPGPAGGEPFAFPPAHWIGLKPKWAVRELDGNKVLAKTLDNALFQRAQGAIAHPDCADYTMQVDIMSEGNRRTMSTAGLIHQRYLIQLKGNYQQIEVSSNMERIKETVPFRWKPGVWYTLKTRVDTAEDGSGVVRAKAWKRGDPEPEGWLIEVEHARAHRNGAPGLFGFAPQSRFPVYVDNLSVTPDE